MWPQITFTIQGIQFKYERCSPEASVHTNILVNLLSSTFEGQKQSSVRNDHKMQYLHQS